MSVIPKNSGFSEISMPVVKTIRLSNGVNINIAPTDNSDMCRIQLIFHNGTINNDLTSLQRITSLALFKGSTLTSREKILNELDYCGIEIERRIYLRHTVFDILVLRRLVARILPIISESLLLPSFDNNLLKVLKQNQKQMIRRMKTAPKSLALMKFKEHAYDKGCKYGIAPNSSDIDKITKNKVIDCYSRTINSGLDIVLSGDVDDKVIAEIEDAFGEQTFKGADASNITLADDIMPNIGKSKIVNRNDAVQSSIVSGLRIPCREHADFIDIRIACMLLGGYFGSRLIQSIRERDGYTYGIFSQIITADNTARMIISTDCDIEYTKKVISGIKIELNRLRDTLPTQSEIEILKSYMLSQMARLIDKSMDIGDYITSEIVLGINPNFFNNQVQRIQTIKPVDIQKAASEYFNPEKLLTVIVTRKN